MGLVDHTELDHHSGELGHHSGELDRLLQPGRIVEISGAAGMGLTRLGLGMLVEPSRRSPVVALDVTGWLWPSAAWEMGVDPGRLVVVRCHDRQLWPQVMAALLDGVAAVYAEVPPQASAVDLRRLAALARARRTGVALRPLGEGLPSGVAHLRLRAVEVMWDGVGQGHGRLGRRRLVLEASGRGMAGMTQKIEMVDDGKDVMRVVSGLDLGRRRAIG